VYIPLNTVVPDTNAIRCNSLLERWNQTGHLYTKLCEEQIETCKDAKNEENYERLKGNSAACN